MANYQVGIDLAVSGGSQLDKILSKIDQLEGIASSINRTPVNINLNDAAKQVEKFNLQFKEADARVTNARSAIASANKNFDTFAEALAKAQRAVKEANPGTKKYTEALQRQEKAWTNVTDAIAATTKAEKDLASATKAREKASGLEQGAKRAEIAAKAIQGLADDYLRLGAAQSKSASGPTGRAQKLEATTVAQLKAQANALQLVANNSKIASSEFNRFSIASFQAGQQLYKANQQSLNAVAFGLSAGAGNVNIGRGGEKSIASARNLVGEFVQSYGAVAKTEAAMSLFVQKGRELQSLLPYLSDEWGLVENAINEVNAEMQVLENRVKGLRGQSSKLQLAPSSLLPQFSVQSAGKKGQFESKVKDYESRLVGVEERIAQAALDGIQKTQLRNRLDEAAAALAEKRLDDTKRIVIEIDRQRQSLERMNRAQKSSTQVFGALGTGFSPVSGELPGGKTIPGSPAAKLEEAKANRESTQAAVSLAKQKQKAIEQEAEELRRSTKAATALGQQKLKALEDEANRLRSETAAAVSLAQQKMREEEKAVADAWKMRGGPALPPGLSGRTGGVATGSVYKTGEFSPVDAKRRLTSTLASGAIIEQSLVNLQGKGADVTDRLIRLQNNLNAAKQEGFEINLKNLNALSEEVALAGKYATLTRTGLAGQAKGGFAPALSSEEVKTQLSKIVTDFNAVAGEAGEAGTDVGSTFSKNLKAGISSAAAAAKAFAEASTKAINKVWGRNSPSRFMIELVKDLTDTYVREMEKEYPRIKAATEKAFGQQRLLRDVQELRATNKGFEFAGRPSTGFKPLPFGAETEGMTQEFNDMMRQFRKNIANLTTQPEIYQSLLNALPNSRITTDLAAAASRRASAAEIPSFMSTQRMLGPGELEKIITSQLSQYLKDIKAPNPWVGAIGDYNKFIDSIIAKTEQLGTQAALPQSRIAGILPSASQSVSGIQAARISQAYERSAQRQLAVFAEDAFGAPSRPALPAVDYGFMADPARIARLSGIGRALPPAIDVAASSVDDEAKDVRKSISNLFDRINDAIRGAFSDAKAKLGTGNYLSPGGGGGGSGFGSGGSGGGTRPPLAGGGGGNPPNDPIISSVYDSLARLGPISKATGNNLDQLVADLLQLRAQIKPTSRGFDLITKKIQQLNREQQRRDVGATGLTRRVGPRTANAISEGLIGGAFPLLFGQGVGASAGGLLGGAAGGFAGGGLGFGLSLIGTALGTAFDQLIQNSKDLGAALQNPIENFDKLTQAAFFSDRALEKQVKKIVDYGDAALASALIQEEALKKFGVDGVANLKELESESDKLNRQWAELTQQLGAFIAGPLAEFLKALNSYIKPSVTAGRIENIRSSLNSEQQKQFDAEYFAVASRGTYKPTKNAEGPVKTELEAFAIVMPEQAQALIDKWQPLAIKGKITITEKDKLASFLNAFEKTLGTIDIVKGVKDKFKEFEQAQKDVDKQRAEAVRSYEEGIGSIRKNIEDEISRRRFSNLEKENQILTQQASNRLASLRLQFAVGGSPDIDTSGIEESTNAFKQAYALASEFATEQLSIENEAAKIKRDAALEAKKLDFEAASFKANIEKEVSRLQLETSKRIAEINLGVRKKNQEYDTNRFKIEVKIAEIKLKTEQILVKDQIKAIERQIDQAGVLKLDVNYLNALKSVYSAQEKVIADGLSFIWRSKAPAQVREVAGPNLAVGSQGIKQATNTLNGTMQRAAELLGEQIAEELAGIDLSDKLNVEKFKQNFRDIRADLSKPAEDIVNDIEESRKEELRYIELVKNGISGVLVQKTLEIEKEIELQRLRILANIAGLEAAKNVAGVSEQAIGLYDEEITSLKAQLGQLGSVQQGLIDDAAAALSEIPGQKIAKAYDEAKTAMMGLANWESIAVMSAKTIGDAFGQAFKEISQGTLSAQEIFANFFQNMANAFADMAAQMIAQMIQMLLFKQILGPMFGLQFADGGIFGFANGGVFGGSAAGTGASPAPFAKGGVFEKEENMNLMAYAKGGVFREKEEFATFAKGGAFSNSIVDSPTLFKFADGGAMQTGVMGEAGPEAVMPLSRDQNGRLGVQSEGGGGDITVNVSVDASGSKVQGDDQRSNQLGRYLAAAVQEELIKQKRPGGLLA